MVFRRGGLITQRPLCHCTCVVHISLSVIISAHRLLGPSPPLCRVYESDNTPSSSSFPPSLASFAQSSDWNEEGIWRTNSCAPTYAGSGHIERARVESSCPTEMYNITIILLTKLLLTHSIKESETTSTSSKSTLLGLSQFRSWRHRRAKSSQLSACLTSSAASWN